MTYFGVLTSTNACVFCCDPGCMTTPTPTPAVDAFGRRVFSTKTGQFVIVVEAAKGLSGLAPATSLQADMSDGRPDIWIENSNDMGNGSATVCDTGPPSAGGGGVPGIFPPDFSEGNQMVTDALLDFACRFDTPATSSATACTLLDASGDHMFITSSAAVQYCDFVADTALFPPGQSVLSVQLRDMGGNLGPTAQVVINVATPTPTP